MDTVRRQMRMPSRNAAAATLVAFALTLPGCVRRGWRDIAVTEPTLQRENIRSRRVRFEGEGGTVVLQVRKVQFPYVEGRPEASRGLVQLDLRTVRRAEYLHETPQRTYRPVALTAEALMAVPGRRSVHFVSDSGSVFLDVVRVDHPWVEGVPDTSDGLVRVDLTRVRGMAVYGVDAGRTAVVNGGGFAFLWLLLATLAGIDSCPLVYVDRGLGYELVGEAYAGAPFAALQGDDLLPLAEVREGALKVRLRNEETREIQFTDRVALVLADHPPGLRVLSTFDGQLVLVDAAVPPRDARDHDRRNVTAVVSERDEMLWETDLVAVGLSAHTSAKEEIRAEVGRPAGRTAVLEIVGGSTPWLGMVHGQFFAGSADRLLDDLKNRDHPSAGSRIRRWRESEGVDLLVEIQDGKAWRKVATVPTTGPAALREIAVPLPTLAGPQSEPIRVRLRGGLGFWRIDRLAFSTRVDEPVRLHHLRPTEARGMRGRDARAVVAAVDGRYNVLAAMDEALDLAFDLPPLPADLRRSAFLLSNGYYEVTAPVQSDWPPGTRQATHKPGGLSRLSGDLARGYVRAAARGRAAAAE